YSTHRPKKINKCSDYEYIDIGKSSKESEDEILKDDFPILREDDVTQVTKNLSAVPLPQSEALYESLLQDLTLTGQCIYPGDLISIKEDVLAIKLKLGSLSEEVLSVKKCMAQQLTAKYENLKNQARKYAAHNKRIVCGTGGGNHKYIKEVVLEAVLELLNKKTVYGKDNNFDDDFVMAVPEENLLAEPVNHYNEMDAELVGDISEMEVTFNTLSTSQPFPF
ncbi:hypothetical protein RN001_003725, partial [Aquatica leii]